MNITIVTCLYDIRKKEGSSCETINTIKDYLSLSQNMLSVRLPMVVFTDEEHIMEHVSSIRGSHGLLEKTRIVHLPFEETYFYKDLSMLKQRMDEFSIINWNKEKDTPLYILLNNNKFDFLQRTMDLDPFQTEFFIWMDMGIQHCTKATEEEWLEVSQLWPPFIYQDRDHIHQLRIHTVVKPDDMVWKDYFKMIYHHVAGGLFGGEKERVREYIKLFQQQWDKILYEEGWWQLDEAIMTIITETYPEKFRFFYGDYDGLLSNFIETKKSFGLGFQTAQRYLDARKHNLVAHVLDTFNMKYITGPEYRERYINILICNDYYYRDGQMSSKLADILVHGNETHLLNGQISNIQHFTDTNIIPFFVRWIFLNPENSWAWGHWQKKEKSVWIYLDPFSKNVLLQNNFVGIDLPFEDNDPYSILRMFQSNFSSSSEDVVFSFYNLLENPENHVYFLYNTPSFLDCEMTEEEHQQHDLNLLRVCGFLKRNFQKLKFSIICLYTNRLWSIPTDQTPSELLVFCVRTPYFLTQKSSFDLYTKLICDWFHLLVSSF